MTKKDYQLIAEVIASAAPDENFKIHKDRLTDSFARKLFKENPKFDTLKFIRVCNKSK